MSRRLSVILVALLVTLNACAEDSLPTSTSGQQAQAGGPTIEGVDQKDEGNGIVSLSVKARDDQGSPLTFRWRVDDGQLSSSSGRAVQWRVPKKAGTFTATVEVTNGKGQTATASQKFTVDDAGKAVAAGTLQVVAANPVNTGAAGRFSVPSPLGNIQARPPIVGGNPAAVAPSVPAPTPPLTQPVATPAPNTPTALPSPFLQPISTPTPVVPTPTPVPSPIPTPRPPTPEPGVPIPPPLRWVKYDSSKVPVRSDLRGMHMLNENLGYIVGSAGVVLKYKRTTPNEEPPLVFKNIGVAPTAGLRHVRFTSEQRGFIAGGNGLVMRTLDAGDSWEKIGPPELTLNVGAMVVVNEQIIYAADTDGNVFRTQSANAANVNNIVWERLPTKPATNVAVWARDIARGAVFPSRPNDIWFVGNGIYKFRADVDPAIAWQKILQFQDATANDPGDGLATDIKMVSESEIWVSTTTGQLYRSFDGGVNWAKLPRDRYVNREFNGNGLFLTPPVPISVVEVPDSRNAFLAVTGGVYDTRDGTASWRSLPADTFNDMQIINVIEGGQRDFRGWALGFAGGFWFYKPG